MVTIKNLTCKAIVAIALFAFSFSSAFAAEVVYKIVEFNKSTQDFILSPAGMVPQDSWAYFQNDYGATTGNRYNQIPRNNKAMLTLEGWKGCTIKSITLSMCSNNKSGQFGLTVIDDNEQIFKQSSADFASDTWFGQWVSKDLNVYVDLKKEINAPALTSDVCVITVQGGTSEGSVYLNSIAIEYDAPDDVILESPLGWSYTKLAKKDVLNDGDEVMIYRNGCAAADFDGMEQSHYLDVVAIASTSDVNDPDVLRFTLNKTADGFWTLTDQFGRKLGATGKQALAWNEGSTLWSIELGYDGATITNSNTAYGTLRYNEPTSGYTRFALYTSKSLPLPFLYLKGAQKQPSVTRSLTFESTEVTADVEEGHIVLKPEVQPSAVTDSRIIWTIDNSEVATVNGGYVTLLKEGTATITAAAYDGGAVATVHLTVTDNSGVESVANDDNAVITRKVLEGSKIVIIKGDEKYDINGVICK